MLTINYLKAVSPAFHLFICLREDIYQILLQSYQHSDKLRSVEKIRWTSESLYELLKTRIEYNLRAAGEDTNNAFLKVFPETVGTSNTMNWLYERTLSRPRELLQLARIYTESNLSITPNSDLLKEAEIAYSNWKLDDLCSEFSNEYPELDRVFTVWKTKFYRSKYHLSNIEFSDICLEILLNANINQQWFENIYRNTDIRELGKILYRIGFIGDFIQGGDGGSKTIYSFTESHDPLLNEVQVHPCFRKAVGTVERIR